MAKHGWNSLSDYLAIHEKTIRFYQKYMESPKLYTLKFLTEFELELECSGIIVHTYRGTRVRIDIKKRVETDPSNQKRPRARTYGYKYSANIPIGIKLILRFSIRTG